MPKFTVKQTFRDLRTGELVEPRPGLVVELDAETGERLQRAQCVLPHVEIPPPAPPATPNGSELEPAPAALPAAPPPAPVKAKKGR